MGTRSARVIIASTRASAGVYDDRCGPIIAEWLGQHGFSSVEPEVVAEFDARVESVTVSVPSLTKMPPPSQYLESTRLARRVE